MCLHRPTGSRKDFNPLAPRGSETIISRQFWRDFFYFNPLAPRGSETDRRWSLPPATGSFNPLAPRGSETLNNGGRPNWRRRFQSTRSAWERDSKHLQKGRHSFTTTIQLPQTNVKLQGLFSHFFPLPPLRYPIFRCEGPGETVCAWGSHKKQPTPERGGLPSKSTHKRRRDQKKVIWLDWGRSPKAPHSLRLSATVLEMPERV